MAEPPICDFCKQPITPDRLADAVKTVGGGLYHGICFHKMQTGSAKRPPEQL